MSIVNPVIYNAAMSGFIAGIQTRRLTVLEPGGSEVVPTDFSTLLVAAQIWAGEVDSLLDAVGPGPWTYLYSSRGVTQVPGNSVQACSAESFPAMMTSLSVSTWEGRGLPVVSSTQLPFAAADYQPVANSVVSCFVRMAENSQVI